MTPGLAAAILAGGKATRMAGRAKSFLPVAGRRIIDRQLEVLAAVADELVIVTNQPDDYAGLGLRVLADQPPGWRGPVAGIATALDAVAADRLLVVACDMPFLSAAALDLLVSLADGVDAVVPRIAGRAEPLHALYRRSCAEACRAALAAGDGKAARLLDRVRVRWVDEGQLRAVDPTLACLTNVNAPDDLAG